MKLSIEDQKKYLDNILEMEPLRLKEENLENISDFRQPSNGDVIADYLIKNAWKDDEDHNTKVFLIRDKKTKELVFYFAINCGILFSDYSSWSMTQNEKMVFENYVTALNKCKKAGLSP